MVPLGRSRQAYILVVSPECIEVMLCSADRQECYQYGFASWLQPVHASLAYAIAIVLLNVAIVELLYRRRIFLRV